MSGCDCPQREYGDGHHRAGCAAILSPSSGTAQVIALLTDIRDELRAIHAEAQPVEEPEPACDHPTDQREDFSTFGVTRFRCKVCGYAVGMEGV